MECAKTESESVPLSQHTKNTEAEDQEPNESLLENVSVLSPTDADIEERDLSDSSMIPFADDSVEFLTDEEISNELFAPMPLSDASLPSHLAGSMEMTPRRLLPTAVVRDVIPEDEEWSAGHSSQIRSGSSSSSGMGMEKAGRRKLSESRGIKLPNIDVASPAANSQPSPGKSCMTPVDGRNGAKGKPKQVTYADQKEPAGSPSVRSQKTPSTADSHYMCSLKNAGLRVDTTVRSAQPSLSSAITKPIEQVNITIYRCDMKGFQFPSRLGQTKTAKNLLISLAAHLNINEKLLRTCCSLWMVSDLLELQLRETHDPWDTRKKWPTLLEKYACADKDEIKKDEPLLFLRRNVHLSVERERLIEKLNCEPLTEILYYAAREEVVSGRYACDLKISVRLAALQMAIEYSPYDEKKHTLKNLCFDISDFFPIQHRQTVKSFYLFGVPVAGRKNIECETFEAFKVAANPDVYSDNHARRKAYLEIVRDTALYGAAFFHGFVERRPAQSVMDIKTMVLNATFPSVEVLVALNREYCAVLDVSQHDLLFITPMSICELGCFEVDPPEGKLDAYSMDCLPVLYLSVEENSDCLDRVVDVTTETVEVPQRYTLLPIYTRQVRLAQFLHRNLYMLMKKSPTQNISICEEKHGNVGRSAASSVKVLTAGGDAESPSYTSTDTPEPKNATDVSRRSSSRQSSPPLTPTSCIPYNMKKMCVARFDDTLRCIGAQGSLKKILQEVM